MNYTRPIFSTESRDDEEQKQAEETRFHSAITMYISNQTVLDLPQGILFALYCLI